MVHMKRMKFVVVVLNCNKFGVSRTDSIAPPPVQMVVAFHSSCRSHSYEQLELSQMITELSKEILNRIVIIPFFFVQKLL